MKTENEIRSSSLEEKQKLVLDLSKVPTGDPYYATAQALIKFTKSCKNYKDPETLDVTNTAEHDVTVDGSVIPKGGTGKVFPWQLGALGRFLTRTGVAPLLAFVFMLGLTALAQTQTYVVGTSGTYNVVSVAGLYGGTNNVVGTNTTYGVPVITTNTVILPNWTFTSGIWTNQPTTNTLSITTNTPGIVSLVNMDMCDVFFGAALTAAGTSAAIASWDVSDDLGTWKTNAYTMPITMAGQSYLSTNMPMTLVPFGYLRLNYISYPSTTVFLTNVTVTVAKKPGRTGP